MSSLQQTAIPQQYYEETAAEEERRQEEEEVPTEDGREASGADQEEALQKDIRKALGLTGSEVTAAAAANAFGDNKDGLMPVPVKSWNCNKCEKPEAGLQCGRCKLTRYCSSACQREDWAVHKQSCVAPPPNWVLPEPPAKSKKRVDTKYVKVPAGTHGLKEETVMPVVPPENLQVKIIAQYQPVADAVEKRQLDTSKFIIVKDKMGLTTFIYDPIDSTCHAEIVGVVAEHGTPVVGKDGRQMGLGACFMARLKSKQLTINQQPLPTAEWF